MARLTWATLTDAERDRMATAVHEAAHAVGVVLAGGKVTDIQVRRSRPEPGIGDPDDPMSDAFGWVLWTAPDDRDQRRMEREVAYWGIWAEARFTHGSIPPWSVISEALAYASDGDLEHLGDGPLPREIESQIEFAMPQIRTLARTIHAQGYATHADVEAALVVRPGLSLDRVRHAFAYRQPLPVSLPGEGVA